MDVIRSTFRFKNFTIVIGDNIVHMNETDEFIVFDWTKDDNREYYMFDISTRTITSLGNYDCENQGPEWSNQNGNGLLLVKFY